MCSLLVLGGARSGKSRYAQARLESCPGRLAYIATAETGDDEMRARVALHRADRGERWTTVEAPRALPAAIVRAGERADAILVDCLTLWVSNLLLADADIALAGEALAQAVAACPRPIALVANEVGLGIVPDNALARRFRDEAGRLNQRIARAVAEVVFIAAGLPMTLKA
jgi:adenosylcobinamide kinase/adenosylcobinamide-phosphate guanylyltransferase